MTSALLPRITAAQATRAARRPVDAATLAAAAVIVDDVRARGTDAVREYAVRFGERTINHAGEQPLVLGRDAMRSALDALSPLDRAALERAATRIEHFARAQRQAIADVSIAVPGGRAGHTVQPVQRAGCYAPAGRHPLPSSVLMTAITARAAGCEHVVVASPGAHPVALAAASIAGADQFLAVGGAHAIAAMATGACGIERRDVIVGPGNRWVTAAKQLVVGEVGIDMLAGPSELLVLADDSADAALVAADLLAQAEHDTDASAMLVTTSASLADAVERELAAQLESLPTRDVARVALGNGFACVVASLDDAIALADRVAPEHLEIMTRDASHVASRLKNAGALFIGSAAAEVLGDYGAGPNHTLPTGGSARYQAGLSVMHFLRLRTWLRIDDAHAANDLVSDTVRLANVEGLAAHAAAAERRLV